jgi:hypothetical protein
MGSECVFLAPKFHKKAEKAKSRRIHFGPGRRRCSLPTKSGASQARWQWGVVAERHPGIIPFWVVRWLRRGALASRLEVMEAFGDRCGLIGLQPGDELLEHQRFRLGKIVVLARVNCTGHPPHVSEWTQGASNGDPRDAPRMLKRHGSFSGWQ